MADEQQVRPPQGELELCLAAIWSDVLGVSPIGRDDRFADLGGTSLAAEHALMLLQRRLGVAVSAQLFADGPTLMELASRIDADQRHRFSHGEPTFTTLAQPEAPDGPAVFCFAGAGSSSVAFAGVAAVTGRHRCVHVMHAHGFTSRALPSHSAFAQARRHLRALRSAQPHGPYVLVGHSWGGHIALAMAELLERAGEQVQRIVLLDTVLKSIHGGSVADFAMQEAARRPPLQQRLRTHLRLLGAGLVQYDPPLQQSIFWELAIRAQNRTRLRPLPTGVTVLITDQNAAQQQRWAAAPGIPPTILRVSGTHNGLLTDPELLRIIDCVVSDVEPAR